MMSILWLLLAGSIVGFGSSIFFKHNGYGTIGYMLMGAIGGLASGGFFAFFGIELLVTWWDYILKGALGAFVVILLSRLIRRG